ncbi:hypothetical protein R1sor_013287 [Riccia sorocarpa]|uniref:F-box domain-containing protein n=1 Tax=Riccia sorocarpa TaxID=122646 RepID=A0ABD3H6N3_9MARC
MSLRDRGEKLMDSSAIAQTSDCENEDEAGRVGWAEMLPETLVEVFKRLPLKDRLQTVPQICKSWRKASFDPGCWQFVNLKEWCMSQNGEVIDRMVKLAVERSCGSIQELHVTNLNSDASLQFLAQSRLSSMKTLCIPGSNITENGLCEVILAMPTLVHLDISRCSAIKSKALEVIGQTCKSLTRLDRSMWPLTMASMGPSDDSEAMAIAHNMPKLKHLEMSSGWLSNSGLVAILDKCPDLEYLDVRNCWNVRFDNSGTVSKCDKLLQFHVSSIESDYDDDEDDDDYVDEWDYTTELWGDFDYLEDYIEDDIF